MRIGILTFHRALNYGAVLQCYALYYTIKSLGHDVEIIDYRPAYIEKYRNLLCWKEFFARKGLISKLRSIVYRFISYRDRKKVSKRFDFFLVSNMKFSKTLYESGSIPSYYDYIVFGSDQIWSPTICEGIDPVFWGKMPLIRTRFITYAASMGGHNYISDREWNDIGNLLHNFYRISVREFLLQNIITEKFQVKAQTVVDPTFLVHPDVFENISVIPQEQDYVLLFVVEKDEKAATFAKHIAEQLHSKVLTIHALPHYKANNGIVDISGVSPGEFCGFFKYAKFVVTISFHGTAFSIIFRKDFYTLHSVQEDRAYNLLNQLGLQNRMVNSSDHLDATKVNYANIAPQIEDLRNSSLHYLKSSLL